jgi:hypothetical protein
MGAAMYTLRERMILLSLPGERAGEVARTRGGGIPFRFRERDVGR